MVFGSVLGPGTIATIGFAPCQGWATAATTSTTTSPITIQPGSIRAPTTAGERSRLEGNGDLARWFGRWLVHNQ